MRLPLCISTAHRTAPITLAKSARKAVAGILDDPAAVLRDLRLDQFSEVRLQALMGSLLIRAPLRRE